MGNKATTIERQIEILKSRGMDFDYGDDKAKEILLDIGYYRLGFYWHPFEIDKDHNLKKGTKFSDVVELYYLDSDLRNLLSKAIHRIEINFRTQIIYNVSNFYPDSPTWFIDKKVISPEFIQSFDNIYNESFKKNNKQIKAHHSKYINDKYAPAWKTLEFLTFGSIRTIYKSLIDENLKNKIANHYNVKKFDVLNNYLNTINLVRNNCAHGGVMFDFNLPVGIKSTPLITFNNNNRHCLDSSIKVIHYFLNVISKNRGQELIEDLNALFANQAANAVLKELIESKICYLYK